MKRKSFLISLLALTIISLSTGCEKNDYEVSNDMNSEVNEDSDRQSGMDSDKESSSKYPDYFEEVLHTLKKHETEGTDFYDDWDTGLQSYGEIPNDQTPGYIDSFADIEKENQYIYYIKWLNIGDGIILKDISFDLSGYKKDNLRWDRKAIFYNEKNDTVYLVFTEFPMLTYDDSMLESHPILMLIEFKPDTPKQYSVILFQTDDYGGAEWFYWTYRINNTLYQMSDMAEIWSIDLITKENHYYEKEYVAANEIATSYIDNYANEGKNVSMHHFYAVMHIDDIVIFRGILSEDMDTPDLKHVYTAYREDELLGYMVIDIETKEIDLFTETQNK